MPQIKQINTTTRTTYLGSLMTSIAEYFDLAFVIVTNGGFDDSLQSFEIVTNGGLNNALQSNSIVTNGGTDIV